MARKQGYRIATAMLCAAFALASCGSVTARGKRLRFDGVPFKTSSKALNKKETLARFEAVVKNALQSEKGARQAAFHEGVSYCIENYGLSDIVWDVDPLDDEQALVLDGDDAVYLGTCDA